MAPACQLCGSVGGGFRKGTMASAHLDDRHFSFSLYATGDFQAATLVLKLIRSESEKSLCGFFKRNFLRLQEFLPPTQSLLFFAIPTCARSFGNLIFLALESCTGGPSVGWDSSLLRYPSQIFIHHTWMFREFKISSLKSALYLLAFQLLDQLIA